MLVRWLRDLDQNTRRNFGLELIYGVGDGVLNGLILVAQVVAVGSLGDRSQAATNMVAARPALALLLPLWAQVARRYRLFDLVLVGGTLRCLPLIAVGWIDQSWQLALVVMFYYLLGGPATLAIPSKIARAMPTLPQLCHLSMTQADPIPDNKARQPKAGTNWRTPS